MLLHNPDTLATAVCNNERIMSIDVFGLANGLRLAAAGGPLTIDSCRETNARDASGRGVNGLLLATWAQQTAGECWRSAE